MSDALTPEAGNDRLSFASLVKTMIRDERHGWSMGIFGAVGEYMRDADEAMTHVVNEGATIVHTERAAIRVLHGANPAIIAYESLSSDGESWGQAVAFCLPFPDNAPRGVIAALGHDRDAIRAEDRDGRLFDLGVGIGHVRFCLRTRDAALIEALDAAAGGALFSEAGGPVMAHILRAQPHRVITSPLGRIEVFAPIPLPDEASPEGPHTHLLPKLVQAGRTHAANAPIPDGMQPVLMLHPGSPWRDAMGQRTPFNEELDADFIDLLNIYGLPEENRLRAEIQEGVDAAIAPQFIGWPRTRRTRTVARITLRRIVRREPYGAASLWRALYDSAHEDGVDTSPSPSALESAYS